MKQIKHQQILKIIEEIRNSHSYMKDIFLSGSCMNFYCILKSIYPEAKAFYNSNHIITSINNKCYDIKGEVSSHGYLPFEEYCDKNRRIKAFGEMYNSEFSLYTKEGINNKL